MVQCCAAAGDWYGDDQDPHEAVRNLIHDLQVEDVEMILLGNVLSVVATSLLLLALVGAFCPSFVAFMGVSGG